MSKRYYWLKLKEDFFTSKRIKKLRSVAGGDTYLIIYLKMQLLALKTDGIIKYTGLEENFASELALDIDEKEDDVRFTLNYLQNVGLVETSDEINFLIPYVIENTGSEVASTIRSRECRARRKVLQCNTNATLLQQNCNGEKEIELEIDKEIDKEEKETSKEKVSVKKVYEIIPPTIEMISQYCIERNNGIDAEEFYDFYESKGWKIGKEKMKNWQACIRTWEKSRKNTISNADEEFLNG